LEAALYNFLTADRRWRRIAVRGRRSAVEFVKIV
jgi:hypothetical protein